jgi:thiol-disulfide isomerase/thioredoxin
MNNFVNMNKIAGASNTNTMYSKLTSITGNFSTKTIIIIVVVLFIILAFFYYFNYVSPKFTTKFTTSYQIKEGEFNTPSKQAELLFFYADWCPHCKSAKPIWNEIKTEFQNRTINGYNILFTEINCSNENAETEQMMNKYNIEGFPTIKLLKDGQIIEYDAKPTKDTLREFLNTVL